ncbi:Mor transcription activator family protein [Bacillus sp. JCM 19041]|uniref:Mor transcription activator family protein n=1 Tax=Bacillus sp. JCM 19041 TaxID=1460637 RepID=UPI000B29A7F5
MLEARDKTIYNQYLLGQTINELAQQFFLSQKSIERIVYKQKRNTSKAPHY